MDSEKDERWADAGPVDALRSRGRALLRLHGLELAVFDQGGELFAMENSCPHAGASLCGGRIENGHVCCPAHGLRFDLRSGQMRSAGLAVRVFPVREHKGRLQLVLPPTHPLAAGPAAPGS